MIEPFIHRLVVRPDKVEDIDPTYARAKAIGIELVEDKKDKLREQAGVDKGKVLAVGPTAFDAFGGCDCKEGDYIAYARHAGKWVNDPDTDEQVLLLNDEDVICRITKKEA